MANIEREFEYNPPLKALFLAAGFFGLCAVIAAYAAFYGAGNKSGFMKIIGNPVVMWIVFAISVGFVLMAVIVAIRMLKVKQRIALTPSSIIVPKSRWSNEEQIINYKDIETIVPEEAVGQHLLNVFHSGGKYTIAASMLPSKKIYDELSDLLFEKTSQKKPDADPA